MKRERYLSNEINHYRKNTNPRSHLFSYLIFPFCFPLELQLDETVLESQGLTVDKGHLHNQHNNNERQSTASHTEGEEEEVVAEENHGRIQRQLETETIQHLNNFQQQMASMQQMQQQVTSFSI